MSMFFSSRPPRPPRELLMLLAGAGAIGVCTLPANAAATTAPKKTVTTTYTVTKADDKALIAAILKNAPTAAQYPNAAAITILDSTDVEIKPDGRNVERTHEMTRIFNERGRGESDISIPYNASNQRLLGLVARTILPDGKVLVVQPDDVHESSPFAGYAMYDSSKLVTFSMPGVEDGAIIDYQYVIEDTTPSMAGQYFENWTFADGENPVKLSRIRITAPAGVTINTKIHNAPDLKPVVTDADGKKTYEWSMSDLADIDPEPMMPPTTTIVPWMQVSTIGSWQDVSDWYWGLEKNRLQITPTLHQLVVEQTAGKTTQEEKAKALFYWVQQNIRYVAVELGQSAFQPHSPQSVYDNRYGDCKDMATLLVTLLRDAGISDSYPVLLHAESREAVEPNLPSLDAFDHCIAHAVVDGKPYWFDCTAEICGFGSIPGGDRGANVLVVHDGGKGEFETVPSYDTPENGLMVSETVKLAADGSAICSNTMSARGDGDFALRGSFKNAKPNLLQDGMRSLVNRESADATLIDYHMSDVHDRDTPFKMDYSYNAPVWAQKAGSLLLFTPAPYAGQGMGSFAKPSRKYPIYSSETGVMQTTIAVTIPDGYTVENLPEDLTTDLPYATFERIVKQEGKTITVTFRSTQKPCLVPPDQYAKVKADSDKLRASASEPIVLKKTGAV